MFLSLCSLLSDFFDEWIVDLEWEVVWCILYIEAFHFFKPGSFWLMKMVGLVEVLFSYASGRKENWKRKLLRKRAFLSSGANMYFFV